MPSELAQTPEDPTKVALRSDEIVENMANSESAQKSPSRLNILRRLMPDRSNNRISNEDETKLDKAVEADEREKWSSKADFLLSLVGLCIGLGNIWRFPYLCYENGGGAFFIPYLLTLIFGGLPCLFMELLLGQTFSVGGLGIWRLCPIFKGVGYASILMAFWLSVYYIVVLAYALYYMFSSFTLDKLPWTGCNNTWNTPNCDLNQSVEEYWKRQVLQESAGIDEPGSLRWPLAGCLLLAWILCYFCIWRGVKWTGKVVYFTALFPYFLLFCLFFRAVTLPGAVIGITHYLKPNMTKLTESKVWLDASSQIFFTYGLGLGSHIALASYNPKRNNCQRDALFVCLVNTLTSFMSGFVIFSFIGHLAYTQGKDNLTGVVSQGPGLAFVVYPAAVMTMPGSALWSVLFFFMLLLVGLDSQFCTLEGLITAVMDEWPKLFKKRRQYLLLGLTITSYLIGLATVTQGGMYVFKVFDHYAASGLALLFLIFNQMIAFSWAVGIDRLRVVVTKVTGIGVNFWWKLCWIFFCPFICFSIIIFSIVRWEPLKYGTYQFPAWTSLVGALIGLNSIVCIPIYMVYYVLKNVICTNSTNKQQNYLVRLKHTLRPRINIKDFLEPDEKLDDLEKTGNANELLVKEPGQEPQNNAQL